MFARPTHGAPTPHVALDPLYGNQQGLGVEVGLQQEQALRKRGCSAAPQGSVSKTSLLLRTAPNPSRPRWRAWRRLAEPGFPRLFGGEELTAPWRRPSWPAPSEAPGEFSPRRTPDHLGPLSPPAALETAANPLQAVPGRSPGGREALSE